MLRVRFWPPRVKFVNLAISNIEEAKTMASQVPPLPCTMRPHDQQHLRKPENTTKQVSENFSVRAAPDMQSYAIQLIAYQEKHFFEEFNIL